MARYLAFLRAINVGGHVVKMDTLRDLFTELGFSKVETFIASGNLIFESRPVRTSELAKKIEKHLASRLGYPVATFLRTPAEVTAIHAYQPFDKTMMKSAQALNVGLLAEPLNRSGHDALAALKTEIDDFYVHGREVYWLCRKKQSESTFTNVRFERLAKTQATFRGISTIARLAEKYGQP
jgi:uncharacterized protein (DUF1697 family)